MRVAVIPARGGSKRIPRKNIRDFAGKPIIAHSIQCARGCDLFDRVILSTDDPEIAAIGREFGAEIPFMRPPELSDDYTGTIDVIAHATQWFVEQGEAPTAVCCIYPTAPFLFAKDLREGVALLESSDWQYVFSATTFAAPIFRSFRVTETGGLEMFFPEKFNVRSQDLPVAFHDAGQFYWGRAQAWLERRRIFDEHSRVVMIPRTRVHDLDTHEDWERAQLAWQVLQANGWEC